MLFDIYGRFQLAIERNDQEWIAYRQGDGVRRRETDIVLPAHLTEDELPSYLDDLYHELALPGMAVRKVKG